MSLTLYKQKRNFRVTAEPGAKKKKGSSSSLTFVVQEHAATNLHYDFRLEADGVLKSWAVPKGPSMNPEDKRLAMMVEDHPYDYKDFEGVIPEGNYGAGNVIVWDNGTYEPVENGNGKDPDKAVTSAIKKGSLKFILHGKKIKGEFALVKMKGKDDNAWLLIKKDDEHATTKNILLKDKSVVTGKKLVPRKAKTASKPLPVKSGIKTVQKKSPSEPADKKARLIKPMLARIGNAAFDHKDWIFEIKYDGYRAIAGIDGKGHVELYSRNLVSFNERYKSLVDELKEIRHDAVLDGEIVVEDKNGISHFQQLQNYNRAGDGKLKYYVFDLLQLDGNDLTGMELARRKELLELLLKNQNLNNIHYSDHISGKGKNFFRKAARSGFEGIMAKHASGIYRAGTRTDDWLKLKINAQQEVVIAGITEPRGGRKYFGSLLLGVYSDQELIYAGHCGTGFNESAIRDLYKKFEPYFTNKSPFDKPVKTNAKAQWMKPVLVCEVKFTEWTADGSMRHPVFVGLRDDKKATEVKREIPDVKKSKGTAGKAGRNAAVDDTELKVGKRILRLTNQDKIYFPEDKISKGDVVNYYREIAPLILPFLEDRPQSMHRFPNGIHAQSFYQKDVGDSKIPSWVKTKKVYSRSNSEYIDYIVCNDAATLIYLANLGCIEINPWNSRTSHLSKPDWMVLDLDPEKISFSEVVKTAKEIHKVLEKMNIPSYCKTSGATGLHIFIPLGARYEYDVVRNFAHVVAQTVNERLPDTTSILRIPAKRQGKVYIDFLQNSSGQTLAAPYSLRPRPGATVSTPLDWDEVNSRLDPGKFTIRTILKRVSKKGDLWAPVIGKGADLDKALKLFPGQR